MTETAADFPVSHWRGLLDSRWQAEVRRVTELSLEFCDAAEHMREFARPAAREPGELRLAAGLLRRAEGRAVAARRSLADIEDAMGRLAAGRFGRCEQCGTDMPARWLTRLPEARYCPRCSPAAVATARLPRPRADRPALARPVLARPVLARPALARLAARLRHAFRPGAISASPGNG
jgi:RNA polymerase-binding transcription factor DksA